MKIIVISLFNLLLLSTSFAAEFRYNNKNLNSLGAVICLMNTEVSSELKTHKISTLKKRVGPAADDLLFELSGTCATKIAKNGTLNSIGDEFLVELKKVKNDYIAVGKIGIKEIQIFFKASNPHKIVIIDPLLLTKQSKNLAHTKWSSSNQIFSFNGDKLSLQLGRKLAAVEDGGALNFKDRSTTFFNLWSETTFGCTHAGSSLSEQECEKFNSTTSF